MDASIIQQFGFSVLSGATGALATTYIALRKFYKEKWWEKRAIAFDELIQSIYVVKQSYQRALDECYEFAEDDLMNSEDWKKVHDIHDRIEKLSQIGPLTLTVKASELLDGYNKKRKKTYNQINPEELDAQTAYSIMVSDTDKLINDLIAHAKSELKISSFKDRVLTCKKSISAIIKKMKKN